MTQGWQNIRLGEALSIKHGFAFSGSQFSDDPSYPALVTPGNFAIGGGFRLSKPKTFTGEVPRGYELSAGDLLITMTDLSKEVDTLGLPALVPEGSRYLHNQRIGLVEVSDTSRVNTDFLSYFLRTAAYRNYIVGTASGSTVRHTSPSRIEDYRAVLPPAAEQQSIAKVLGALDDKIAANTKLALLAEDIAYMRYRVGTAALEQVPMSEMLAPVLGGTPSRSRKDYWGGNQRWVSGKDVTGAFGHLVLDTEEKITTAATEETKAKPLPKGSVILTARGTVGAVARLGEPSSFNQSCYGFVPGSVPTGILYFAIRSAAEHAKSIAHGSVFDTITMKSFDHLLVPLITGNEAQSLEEMLSPLLAVVETSARENLKLSKLRDSLLPHLMSGKLRVKDAEKVVEAVV